MKFDIKIEGTQMVINNLRGLDESVIKDVQEALTSGASTVAERARANAPFRTGRLRSAIKSKPMPIKEGWSLVSIAMVDSKIAPHAWLMEYGRNRKPYLRPAFDSAKGGIQAKINSALSGAVRRHN